MRAYDGAAPSRSPAQLDGVLFRSSWQTCNLPPLTGQLFGQLVGPAVSMASIGLIETVLTQQLVDEMTHTRTSVLREVLAQGTANLVAGCFTGMGGCAMIGQTAINIHSGGRHRHSALFGSLFLFLTLTAVYKVGSPQWLLWHLRSLCRGAMGPCKHLSCRIRPPASGNKRRR